MSTIDYRTPVLAVLDAHDPDAATALRDHWRACDRSATADAARSAREAKRQDAAQRETERAAAWAPVAEANARVHAAKLEHGEAKRHANGRDVEAMKRYHLVHFTTLPEARKAAAAALSAYRARHEGQG
jgi:hypothetical protein